MAASLKEASQSSFIKALGDIATGKFTCGGTLAHKPPKVQLNYLDLNGMWSGATFPGLEGANLQKILETATLASFGRGKETVTDKSYRDAYAIDPDMFITSFQLSNTGILGEVRLFLLPEVLDVCAELYKMNIYTAPTGCFKAHVDTPRGGTMFGSLVVCLPSRFDGGALVTRHNGEQVTYNWSSPADNPVQNIQWAAFFSDVEHEILPVTEGYRVTLTYNLYHCNHISSVPAVDVTTSSFYHNLKAALGHPIFLRCGGVLGFACQHAYVFEELNYRPQHRPQHLLKGSDRLVMLAAESLGLKVEVKPYVDGRDSDFCKSGYIGDQFGFKTMDFQDKQWEWECYFNKENFNEEKGISHASHITWCQKCIHWQPAIAAVVCGNDAAYIDVCYQAAAILVTVPSWSEKRLNK